MKHDHAKRKRKKYVPKSPTSRSREEGRKNDRNNTTRNKTTKHHKIT
jgi:hypothetical protein